MARENLTGVSPQHTKDHFTDCIRHYVRGCIKKKKKVNKIIQLNKRDENKSMFEL